MWRWKAPPIRVATVIVFTRAATVVLLVGLLAGSPARAQSPLGDPMTIGVELVVGAGLTAPVTLASPPDGSGRLFVVDQVGLIRVLRPDRILQKEPFLDLRDRLVALRVTFDERGLLGLAFHPQYATSGRFFVYYSAPLREGAPSGFDHTSHISEFRVSGDPNRADPDSERLLLQVDQPQFNHNGGTLAFGPDGKLYISLGDGGGANDVGLGHVEDWYEANRGGNGQDVEQNLLGSILRIDVDTGSPYGIPPDNPFVGTSGRDEIWAYGFRNPYRFSFDHGGSHELYAGDAGQNLWEEVSLVVKGGNYGWNVKEGTHCFDTEDPFTSPPTCPDTVGAGHPDEGAPLRDPIIEYPHFRQGGFGLTVIGGHVYRGSSLPQLSGLYVFGDWSTSFGTPDGTLLVARPRMRGLWQIHELAVQGRPDGRLGHFVLGFGQDAAGEVYVLTSDRSAPTGDTGRVYRLVRPGAS
jgi:glucose/arabinose dehydrogenase